MPTTSLLANRSTIANWTVRTPTGLSLAGQPGGPGGNLFDGIGYFSAGAGNNFEKVIASVRWTYANVNIPQGSTINSATLSFHVNVTNWIDNASNKVLKIRANTAPNPTATKAGWTTAQTDNWNTSMGFRDFPIYPQDSKDITGLIQTLVDNNDYSNGTIALNLGMGHTPIKTTPFAPFPARRWTTATTGSIQIATPQWFFNGGPFDERDRLIINFTPPGSGPSSGGIFRTEDAKVEFIGKVEIS